MSMLFVSLGALAALLAVLNATQALLGRRLIGPSAGTRPARRLRAESAAAAVAMSGAALAAFGIPAGGRWPALGGAVTLAGWTALVLVRRRFTARA
ncbi:MULTISPECIES: hypothetical protein [unclassified Streptomyces]|uniref:hypothetical protein n=1 Tax=unclassified Streptomyces TaxID=2593676 RepID=UPI00117CA6AF|nr:hypothetical protein [Streptomyces sp. 1-11]